MNPSNSRRIGLAYGWDDADQKCELLLLTTCLLYCNLLERERARRIYLFIQMDRDGGGRERQIAS